MQPDDVVPRSHHAMRAALAPPPAQSAERDRQLLDLAGESGIGGQALSLLERVDIAALSMHDRITFLRLVTSRQPLSPDPPRDGRSTRWTSRSGRS